MSTDSTSETFFDWRQLRDKLVKTAIFFVFIFFLIPHFGTPITLVTADLGRHLKNGELILSGQYDILHKNVYSYTQPEFPFTNHHWGSGVLFYWIYLHSGFVGLSFFYIAILILTTLIFFRAAEKMSSFSWALLASMIAMPILTDRLEIRPEGISTLMLALYFYLFYGVRSGWFSWRWVWLSIPVLQLLWVNTHLFFFMGGVMAAVFGLDALIYRRWDELKKWIALGVVIAGVSLINPAGLKGVLVPLGILKEYGYMLAENQSIFFMQKRFIHEYKYYYYEAMALAAAVGMIAFVGRRRDWRSGILPGLLVTFFAVLGFKSVRAMAMFGLFFVPFFSLLGHALSESIDKQWQRIVNGVVLLMGCSLMAYGIFSVDNIFSPYSRLGILVSPSKQVQQQKGFLYLLDHPEIWSGLAPGVNGSAEFFKREHIQGPIFNNYDIGGYLIFHLYPEYRMFVDNRPEVYSVDFFQKRYIPMQTRAEIWQEEDAKYGFNVIYFYRHDMTPWGQEFLVRMVQDPAWAPVFVDGYTIIFLKRNSQNHSIIARHEIPRDYFGVTKNPNG